MRSFQHLQHLQGFQGDQGNRLKNWEKHQVSELECEQVFFNHPLLIHPDSGHSHGEGCFHVLGKTDVGRKLFISFTIRDELIRVISARDQHKKERSVYEQAS
jgi:uncharacterized protein